MPISVEGRRTACFSPADKKNTGVRGFPKGDKVGQVETRKDAILGPFLGPFNVVTNKPKFYNSTNAMKLR